jgi:hypothetical protein
MARFLACAVVGILAAVGVVGCGDDSGSSVSARDNTPEATTTTTMATSTEADFVGLTKKAAIAKAEAEGRPWRIASEDGESFPATLDYNPNRVSFDVTNGMVTKATFG